MQHDLTGKQTPFQTDSFALIWRAFRELYPDKECEVFWHPEIEKEAPGEEIYGLTDFGDDSSVLVFVSSKLTVENAAEVLAHELAHVAVGVEKEHGPEWEQAFEAIHEKYEEIILEEIGKGV